MADTVYQLSDVVKRYRKGRGEVLALRGVDLVIRDGEWLAIQGPTGHGKSTLLQILGGLDRPTSGTVEFDGVDLARLPETRVTRERARSIGFVFQTFNLIPTLSAAENVEVALVPLGFPRGGMGGRRGRRGAGPRSASATGCGTCRPNCPAASSSGWRSPVRWSRSPGCCWSTSRPATSTRAPGTRSSPCSRTCGARRGLTMVLVTHDVSSRPVPALRDCVRRFAGYVRDDDGIGSSTDRATQRAP